MLSVFVITKDRDKISDIFAKDSGSSFRLEHKGEMYDIP